MMIGNNQIESVFKHMVGIIHTQICIFDENYHLEQTIGSHEILEEQNQDQMAILNTLTESINVTQPILHSKDDCLLYAGFSSEKPVNYYVIGPVCTIDTLNLTDRNTLYKGKASYCDYRTFCEGILILYELISGETVKYNQLQNNNINVKSIENTINEKFRSVSFRYREHVTLHNSYSQEEREQKSIQEGNVENFYQSIQEVNSGQYAVLSNDELRSKKNLGIVVMAISARSAIRGGLRPEEAFTMSDGAILAIDESTNEKDIHTIVRQTEEKMTKLVAGLKNVKIENPIVKRCIDEIDKSLHQRIKLKDLANRLKVNVGYLSKVFHEEMGMTIAKYVNKEKLEVAEKMLIFSDYSIEEISNYLAYSSQSHFGTLFKKKNGLTPKEYRKMKQI